MLIPDVLLADCFACLAPFIRGHVFGVFGGHVVLCVDDDLILGGQPFKAENPEGVHD